MTHLGGDFPPGAGVLDVMYESPSTLLSCGYDTYVRYWDLRASVRDPPAPGISTLRCLTTSMAWTFKPRDRATPACGPEEPATQGPLLPAGCSDTSSPALPGFLDL
ncbi:hypothetical protein E2I00_000278 [Balaenoptera physalus]|uniref:F-box/WD repeat-containing protein 4 n=1 Tax=Balaenoptera physalus TaxID=9770 RepID=A0A6A1QAB5_BALPH|nr:hypothetical protein E2I00_000278 [Balaenoptera physalus]